MFESLQGIVEEANKKDLPFWKIVQVSDCHEQGITEEESFTKMTMMYQQMKASTNFKKEDHSSSGLIGGETDLLMKRIENNEMISGDFISNVMVRALAVASNNACMRRIVAAPTAGSCGVLPAVLLTYQQTYSKTDEAMVESLYVAAGIGAVISKRACLAGAQGGCQAEIGSASAMAAGALTYLNGGNSEQIIHASALALKGLLGLACDPVAGLVEVPCVKRNVIGSVNAVTSCDMARSGITSKIPPDEVIDAMRSIGSHMPVDVRETGIGGLAGTKTGQKIAEKLKGL